MELISKNGIVTITDEITKDTTYKLEYPFQSWSIEVTPNTGGQVKVYYSNSGENFSVWDRGEPATTTLDFFGNVGFVKVELAGGASSCEVFIRGV